MHRRRGDRAAAVVCGDGAELGREAEDEESLLVYVPKPIEALLRNLHCAVCLQVLDRTVTAPCMHRFCQECVEKCTWLA